MNTSILQKCVEELDKEAPSIPYIKGMLETLIIMSTPVIQTYYPTNSEEIKNHATKTIGADQPIEEVPAFLRAGPTGNVRG
jgi:hypothetical protein